MPAVVGPLTWERFTAAAGWTLVPDEGTGRVYKAELTLREHPVGTLRRMNIWYEPGLRGTGQPNPHSHPWPFPALRRLRG
ncbi:hypothetical protein [Streptosporangium sp. NPDC002721]|uniref:hypothetical protein n=1 Tax=Streptosporangium sp. NPDC002721 TaxID=3366188 RepID=UPI00367FA7AD